MKPRDLLGCLEALVVAVYRLHSESHPRRPKKIGRFLELFYFI